MLEQLIGLQGSQTKE